MTNQEAIDFNKNLKMYMKISDKSNPCKFLEENYVALDMAIKALEQEQYYKDLAESYEKTINKLTKAIAEQEPKTDGDCISRQAAEEITWEEPSYTDALNVLTEVREKIRRLPSVKPQEPKTGHWIYDKSIENWKCSECGETPKTLGYVGDEGFMKEHFKFCNHCGAKMESEKNVCKDCYYNDGEVHAECVICDRAESEDKE